MSHLPVKINNLVIPFLENFIREQPQEMQKQLHIFDIDHYQTPGKYDEYLAYELNRYHWWWSISMENTDEEFTNRLAVCVEKIKECIKIFNRCQDICNLRFIGEVDVGASTRINQKSQDKGLVYFFLIVAKQKNNDSFTYGIPIKYKSQILSDDIKPEFLSNDTICFEDDDNTKTTIKFVDEQEKITKFYSKI